MPSDGNKGEEKGNREVIILCSTNMEIVIPGGEAERKFIQNSSHGTTHSTHFRRIKCASSHSIPSCLTYQTVP
ncbi:hypothetical protein ACFX1R_041906 [Malus domestica]